jgi:hypothetical protein
MPSYDYNGRRFPAEFLDLVYGDKTFIDGRIIKWTGLTLPPGFQTATLDSAYTYSFERPGIKNYGLGWRMFGIPTAKNYHHNGW